MFSETAQLYDLVYSGKDYAGEAAHVRGVVNAAGVGDGVTLLDVACGTGRHLEQFQTWFDVEGLDLDEKLIAIGQERLPDVPLHVGDMRNFALASRFDAVTCLFGSVAYARTFEGLHAAVRNMASHLTDGGVLVVEPFIFSDRYEVGRPTALFIDRPDIKLARLHVAEAGNGGGTAVFDFHYVVATRDAGVQTFRERHEIGLFGRSDYEQAFSAAGLTPEFDPVGPMGRGLFVGRKS